jgi:Rrf2 family transcriptional regulator, iron-sulfur cluster assembly transcription factor
MKLTTRGRYAVTAMLDLALHHEQGPVRLSEIASRQSISLSYLEQLFAQLRKTGLVLSARGPGGGYLPGRPISDISVADVILAVDEHVDATRCGGQQNCQRTLRCLTHDLWEDLSNQISNFLNGISLFDLVQRRTVKQVSQRQDFIMHHMRIQ